MTTTDPARLPAGTRLGNYIVQCPIGQGGFGVIYRAHHAHFPERLVAIKVPRDASSAGSLLRAGALQGRVDHPGIVKVLDVEPDGQTPHLVLEWIEGETLAQRIGRGPLPPKMAATILDRIADAIQLVHQRGLCHGDIKPSNILLGMDGRIALTDFGAIAPIAEIRRNLEWSLGSVELTSAVGTLGYLAPEQREGQAPDAGGDLYSMGVILFEMLTGRLPALSDRLMDGTADALYRDLCAPANQRLASIAEMRARLRAMGADSNAASGSAPVRPPVEESFLDSQTTNQAVTRSAVTESGGFCPDEFKRPGVSAFVPAEFQHAPDASKDHPMRPEGEGFHAIKINEGTPRLTRRAMWLFTLGGMTLTGAVVAFAGAVAYVVKFGAPF